MASFTRAARKIMQRHFPNLHMEAYGLYTLAWVDGPPMSEVRAALKREARVDPQDIYDGIISEEIVVCRRLTLESMALVWLRDLTDLNLWEDVELGVSGALTVNRMPASHAEEIAATIVADLLSAQHARVVRRKSAAAVQASLWALGDPAHYLRAAERAGDA